MKKSDMAMIVLIVILSVIISYFITSSFFGDFSPKPTNVKTIDSISPEISEPSPDIFNEEAINPAVQVQTAGNDKENSNPGTQ